MCGGDPPLSQTLISIGQARLGKARLARLTHVTCLMEPEPVLNLSMQHEFKILHNRLGRIS